MVLESLFPAKKIISKPLDMLILSFVASFASVFLANWVFTGLSSGRDVTLFTTIVMTPIIYRLLKFEEETEREEAEHKIQKNFFERHGKTIWLFTLFFIGNFLAIFLIAIFSPPTFVATTFNDQLNAIKQITTISGAATLSTTLLEVIIINNLKVMIFSFVLSFLIGTGALIILSWNASVLALYLAQFIRQGLFSEFFGKAVGIIPHAPVEILAYFLAGIAGGILSVGIIREKIRSKEFGLVFRDSLIMLTLSVIAVFAGAFLEVFL